jgi:formylglycine-generating enzyme required for sulfatase activity
MTGDESGRVFRGGGWLYQPSFARVAFRGLNAPGYRSDFLGVRLVRMVLPLQQLGEVKYGK